MAAGSRGFDAQVQKRITGFECTIGELLVEMGAAPGYLNRRCRQEGV